LGGVPAGEDGLLGWRAAAEREQGFKDTGRHEDHPETVGVSAVSALGVG